MINAKSIYNLLSFRDQDNLNFSHLLNIIVDKKDYNVNFRIIMIRLIIINSKIDMINAHNSFYMTLIYNVEENWNQKFTKTILTMWKALIVDRVLLNYFDDHDITSLIVAIENASSAFLKDHDILKKNEMKQLSLNFLTFNKNDDISYILA